MKYTIETLFKNIYEMQRILEFCEDNDNLSNLINYYEKTLKVIIKVLKRGNRVFIAGNGGSAADSMHFAGELAGRYYKSRRALNCEALLDVSVITCIANDYGYEFIFSKQLEGKMKKGDVFIGLSTSGNSKNINNALTWCKNNGMISVSLLGKDGGQAKKLSKYTYIVNSNQTNTVQEFHKLILHSWAAYLDKVFK
jgi:D-sedoheptulose 7-phosphate isomerase